MRNNYVAASVLLLLGVGCVGEVNSSETLTSVTLPEGAYLRVANADGADLAFDADGLIRAAIFVGHANDLQTVGLELLVEGAEIVEWQRDDGLLTRNGGSILQLAGSSTATTLELVVATTRSVSAVDERIATLTLRPTDGTGQIFINVNGDSRGLISADGTRFNVTAVDATF